MKTARTAQCLSLPSFLLLCLCHLTQTELVSINSSSTLYYLNEPPEELECNPYNNRTDPPSLSTPFLCTAVAAGVNSDSSTLWHIAWHREDSDGSITSFIKHPFINNVLGVALLNDASAANSSVNDSLWGNYYCIVSSSLSNENETMILRSKTLQLLPPENYSSLVACSPVITDDKKNCQSEESTVFFSSSSPTSTLIASIVISSSPSVSSPSNVTSPTSVVGWIVGIAFTSVLVIILSIIVLVLLLMYKNHYEIKPIKGMPITYRKKNNELSPPDDVVVRNEGTVSPTSDHRHDSYDYINWGQGGDSSSYLQTNTSINSAYMSTFAPRSSTTPRDSSQTGTLPTPPQKRIEGKLYAIADFKKRDTYTTYQDVHK